MQIVTCIGFGLFSFRNHSRDDAVELFGMPMFSFLPPLLNTGISNQIPYRPLDLFPRRCGQSAVRSGEIHPFKIVEETVEERAELQFRNGIEIDEGMNAAEINDAQLGAVVQRARQISPLNGERVHCGLSSLFRLRPNFAERDKSRTEFRQLRPPLGRSLTTFPSSCALRRPNEKKISRRRVLQQLH